MSNVDANRRTGAVRVNQLEAARSVPPPPRMCDPFHYFNSPSKVVRFFLSTCVAIGA